ncbi:MAG: diaminopimelate epimerase [Desulfobacterales bacterium]|nr:MAG: diaminopimelate epimerase [Desulfobacterales bacterium]
MNTPIPFVKMSGTGNDFIIIDHRYPFLDTEEAARFAKHVCSRRVSIGADGLLLIENSDQADFKWQFFNSDGSVAEMCGNGARCAARYAYMHGIAPAIMRFETLAGVIEARVSDVNVTIRMTAPHSLHMNHELKLSGEERITVHTLDTGVPHVVYMVDDANVVNVQELGSIIRYHKDFQPAGTNVNFVSLQDGGLKVRTYERGVENETLACGTGAVASSVVAHLLDKVSSPVQVTTSGGDQLEIRFNMTAGSTVDDVFLKGPALCIYQGELTAEALLGLKKE